MHHQSGSDQQRPETQHPPIDQEAGQAPAPARGSPDAIKGFFDIGQHQVRRHDQNKAAHPTEIARLT